MNDEYRRALLWRDIYPDQDIVCERCGGSGKSMNLDDLHGMAAEPTEPGICHKCWGSGATNKPGVNLKMHVSKTLALIKACQAALQWRGLDGDGITDPVRQMIADAVEKAGSV